MKKLLLIVGLLALTLPAFAGVDVKETTTPQFLDNYGISDEGIRLIQVQKAAADGRAYEAQEQNVNFVRRFFNYLDPARDKGTFWRHDIKYYPNTKDLL